MALKFGAEEDVTQEEIREKLRLHRLWVDGKEGGVRADLSDADLRDAVLRRTDLSDANLRRTDLRRTDLSDANLRRTDLRRTDLRRTDLSWANLSWANLSWANLGKADLSWADLSWANLGKADLSGAYLHGANLGKAILRGATGNGKEIKSAQVHTYGLVWTKDVLWIGCQRKTLDEWELFDPRADGLSARDCAAWEAHKDWIFETVRRFPAE